MKTLLLLAAVAFFATPLAAQDKPQQNAAEERVQTQQPATQQPAGQRAFVDEDGDGINDRVGGNDRGNRERQAGQHQRQRNRDRFIDHDGDGIHDERCGGTGFRQGRRQGAAKGGGK